MQNFIPLAYKLREEFELTDGKHFFPIYMRVQTIVIFLTHSLALLAHGENLFLYTFSQSILITLKTSSFLQHFGKQALPLLLHSILGSSTSSLIWFVAALVSQITAKIS